MNFKVTVIATGFPEEAYSTQNNISRRVPTAPSRIEPEDEVVVESTRGRIFNSTNLPRKPEPEPVNNNIPTANTVNEIPKRDPKPVDPIEEDDGDDWGAVPAFCDDQN